MNQTTRSVAEDEMSLVESEIAAQREMLKEADTTLNSILNKMEDDVVDVSERDPGKLKAFDCCCYKTLQESIFVFHESFICLFLISLHRRLSCQRDFRNRYHLAYSRFILTR